MNKERRARLDTLRQRLGEIDADLSQLLSEEEEAHENLPDSIKDGCRGAEMEENIEKLTDACGDIEQAIGTLSEVQ